MQTASDLTKGRVSTRLLGFFFPMLLTNTLQQTYTFIDTVIVGKGLGDRISLDRTRHDRNDRAAHHDLVHRHRNGLCVNEIRHNNRRNLI